MSEGMIATRSAWLMTIVAASLALLAGAGVTRMIPVKRPEFVAPLAPATTGPHVTWSGQGVWRVPDHVKPGEYAVYAGDRECGWQRLKDFSGADQAVLEEGRVPPRTSRRVLVYASDRGFRTMGPCEWELLS